VATGPPPQHYARPLLSRTKRLTSFKSPVFQSARRASLITITESMLQQSAVWSTNLNVYKEDAFLEFVFHTIHDFSVNPGILFAASFSLPNSTFRSFLWTLNFRRQVIKAVHEHAAIRMVLFVLGAKRGGRPSPGVAQSNSAASSG